MQIDNNMTASANNPLAPATANIVAPAAATVPVARLDSAAFNQSMNLEKDLNNTEDARAEKVERALNLIGQVQWPPTTVIRRIANLLASNMERSSKFDV